MPQTERCSSISVDGKDEANNLVCHRLRAAVSVLYLFCVCAVSVLYRFL